MLPQLALLSAGLFSGLASAQYVIAPSSVPLFLRDSWCDSQITQCPLICLQYNDTTGAETNNCDASNLSYECTCDNGLAPNSSEYSLTLPFYVCQEWGNQCVTNCGSANNCAEACRTQHPCGAKSPTRVNTTTSTTMSMTSSSADSSTETFGAFSAAASSSSFARPSYTATYTHVGNRFGFLVVGAGLVGGLAFLL